MLTVLQDRLQAKRAKGSGEDDSDIYKNNAPRARECRPRSCPEPRPPGTQPFLQDAKAHRLAFEDSSTATEQGASAIDESSQTERLPAPAAGAVHVNCGLVLSEAS